MKNLEYDEYAYMSLYYANLRNSFLKASFENDLILMPFFFDEIESKDEEMKALNDNHMHVIISGNPSKEIEALCGCSNYKRALLVSLKMQNYLIDLFDIEERDNDNYDISTCVL